LCRTSSCINARAKICRDDHALREAEKAAIVEDGTSGCDAAAPSYLGFLGIAIRALGDIPFKALEGIVKVEAEAPDMEEADGLEAEEVEMDSN
jgi:hypothetical protein